MPSKLLLMLVLLLLAGGIISVQGYSLYRYQLELEQNYQPPTLVIEERQSQLLPLDQVANLRLFGDAKTAPVVEDVPKELPRTDLKLVLVGVIANSTVERSSALIQSGSETKRHFLGDSVAAGVVLHEVRKNEIVLKRDNRFETLGFPLQVAQPPAPLGYGVPRAGEVPLNKRNTMPAPRARPVIAQPRPATNNVSNLSPADVRDRINALQQLRTPPAPAKPSGAEPADKK